MAEYLPVSSPYGEPNYFSIGYGDDVPWRDINGNIYDRLPVPNDAGYYGDIRLLLSSDVTNSPEINLLGLENQPDNAREFYNLKQSNPQEFYKQYASRLAEEINYAEQSNMAGGQRYDDLQNELNKLEQTAPEAYYLGKINNLANRKAWMMAEGNGGKTAYLDEAISALLPKAISSGVNPDALQNTFQNSYQSGFKDSKQQMANAAASSGYWADNLKGAAFVGASALGAYGLDSLLTAGAASGALAGNAGVGLGSSVPSLVTGLEVGTGGALAGTGAGAAAVPAGGALASLGSLGYVAPTIGGSAGFLAPTLGANAASTGMGLTAAQVPSLIGGLEVGAGSTLGSMPFNFGAEQMGPTYQELGVTGVEGGMAGPTYGELGYTGLNQAEAIAAADAAAKGGLSASDILTNANRAKNIAKLLTDSEESKLVGKNIPTANQWATQASQNLAQATPEQFGGYYQMNQNPFTFQNPLANALAKKEKQPGFYDVSGTQGQALNTQNQQANLLRMFG